MIKPWPNFFNYHCFALLIYALITPEKGNLLLICHAYCNNNITIMAFMTHCGVFSNPDLWFLMSTHILQPMRFICALTMKILYAHAFERMGPATEWRSRVQLKFDVQEPTL